MNPSRTPGVRIVIADDHPIFRDGLRKLLSSEPDFAVVGEANDGYQALKLADTLHPDVLLLDLSMRPSGLEILRQLATRPNSTRSILVTAAIDNAQILEALQLGARGVVLKESATGILMKCIRLVMAGQYWVGNEAVADLVKLLRHMTTAVHRPVRKFGLTPREYEVIATIVAGFSNKDIANKFSISEDTVKHHLTNIFDKLGVSTRLELATFAISHHLLDSD